MLDVQLDRLDKNSGVRLRSYQMVKSVLEKRAASENALKTINPRAASARITISSLGQERRAKNPTPSKKQISLIDKRIKSNQTTLDRLKPQVDFHRSVLRKTDTLNIEHSQEVQNAERWVTDSAIQNVNVRILGDWHTHGSKWVQRNETGQGSRTITEGEYLNAPDSGWTDYINQGWMQGGYDRGAMFRLLTKVPQEVVTMHNKAAGIANNPPSNKPQIRGNWVNYEKRLSTMPKKAGFVDFKHSSENRMTYMGQELVNAASKGYSIHSDRSGRQSIMPQNKSRMLTELRSKIPRIE